MKVFGYLILQDGRCVTRLFSVWHFGSIVKDEPPLIAPILPTFICSRRCWQKGPSSFVPYFVTLFVCYFVTLFVCYFVSLCAWKQFHERRFFLFFIVRRQRLVGWLVGWKGKCSSNTHPQKRGDASSGQTTLALAPHSQGKVVFPFSSSTVLKLINSLINTRHLLKKIFHPTILFHYFRMNFFRLKG